MTGLWLRTELRRRWRALLVLGVLAGLTAGLAIAAIDGARRAGTALDRNERATLQPDVMVLPSRPGFDWTPISRLPQVRAIGLFGVVYSLAATDVGPPGALTTFPAANRAIDSTVDRLRIVEGRHVDPSNPHEVVVTAAAVHQLHLRIGQRFTITGPTPEQVANAVGSTEPPKGPRVRVRIVGIIGHDSLWGRYLGSTDRTDDPTMVGFTTSPALVERYRFGYAPNALVRLRRGAADLPAFRRAVARLDPTIPIRDLARDRARFARAIRVEQTALVLFALAVTAAGVVLLGQALVRVVQGATDDAVAASALGATRRQIAIAASSPTVVAAGSGAIVAVATAAALSARFPIGLARSVEVDLGVHLDALVTGVGVLVLATLVGLGALVTASRLLVAARVPPRLPVVGRVVAGLHLPLPAQLGARMALHRGRGRHAVPVGPALVAAMAGVIGIVGAFTFRAGLDDAVGNVDLAGTTWQRVAYTDPGTPVDQLPELDRTPRLRAAALVDRAAVRIGDDSVSMWSFHPLVGEVRRVVIEGRLPVAPGEATVGWTTARRHHLHVGGRVSAEGSSLRVVGIGLLPEQAGHSAYDEGMWVTPETFSGLRGAEEVDDREVLADFRGVRLGAIPSRAELQGSDPASRALSHALGSSVLYLEPATAPAAMTNLSAVRGLPVALGVFLVLLAVGALGHSLASSVTRRRGDLAVMRAIGTTPRQTRAMVAVHATVVGIVGLVVGVPLGVIVGRSGWRWVADTVPFIYVGPLAALVLVLAVPAALAVANAVAALPGRTAAHLRPADVLRAE